MPRSQGLPPQPLQCAMLLHAVHLTLILFQNGCVDAVHYSYLVPCGSTVFWRCTFPERDSGDTATLGHVCVQGVVPGV
eukprot:scaffold81834_cov22-Tisochrysis_lutea.AAC.1